MEWLLLVVDSAHASRMPEREEVARKLSAQAYYDQPVEDAVALDCAISVLAKAPDL